MRNFINLRRVIALAAITELSLFLLQFIFIAIYATWINPEAPMAFTAGYMRSAGFYIFQVVGFFAFILIAYVVICRSGEKVFVNALALFITGAVLELLFYIIARAPYQGVFMYSVLDKTVAIVFGAIIYISRGREVHANT